MTTPNRANTTPAADAVTGGGELALQLLLSARQTRLLRQAAMTSGYSLDQYITNSACVAAYTLLTHCPEFLMDDPDWEHFLSLLDQPPSELPALKSLLNAEC